MIQPKAGMVLEDSYVIVTSVSQCKMTEAVCNGKQNMKIQAKTDVFTTKSHPCRDYLDPLRAGKNKNKENITNKSSKTSIIFVFGFQQLQLYYLFISLE
jgi:hypothetical protein